jgi:Family of unknown function (DUF6064)
MVSLPFTLEEFLDVFARYNEAIWPAQWVLLALALAAVVAVLQSTPRAGRVVSGTLALLWFWAGLVYHIGFFVGINRAALLFAALFLVQALLFAWVAVRECTPFFRLRADARGIAATVMVVYATMGYPLLANAIGHHYPELATFGAPCPTTIFTLALMLVAEPALPRVTWAVPLLWAGIGTSAAVQLEMREDYGLTIAAVATLALLLLHPLPASARPVRALGG